MRNSLFPLLPLILVAIFPATLASLFSFNAPTHRQVQNEKREARCLNNGGVHIIAVSGHGAGIHNGYGLLNTTVDSILKAIPGSTNYSIPYPKDEVPEGPAITTGEANLMSNVEGYAGRCPNTPIVLIGYSEGAIITMNVLCGQGRKKPYGTPFPSEYAQNIIATIIYGDETRIPNQPYDEGTCTKGHGEIPRHNPKGCAAFAPNIQSYCDKPDPRCCGGNNISVHYTYPAKYNAAATKFVVKQYKALE